MTTHSIILAWRIPWTEEPNGLQSMGLQRVGHDWETKHTHYQKIKMRVSAVENVEKLEFLHTGECKCECKMAQPLWNTIWVFLKKFKAELPYNLAIPGLGMYWKELKSGSQRDTCTLIFIIAKMWKQLRCPSTDEWTKIYGTHAWLGAQSCPILETL